MLSLHQKRGNSRSAQNATDLRKDILQATVLMKAVPDISNTVLLDNEIILHGFKRFSWKLTNICVSVAVLYFPVFSRKLNVTSTLIEWLCCKTKTKQSMWLLESITVKDRYLNNQSRLKKKTVATKCFYTDTCIMIGCGFTFKESWDVKTKTKCC